MEKVLEPSSEQSEERGTCRDGNVEGTWSLVGVGCCGLMVRRRMNPRLRFYLACHHVCGRAPK